MKELQGEASRGLQARILRHPALVVISLVVLAIVLRFAFIGADLPPFLSKAQDDVYNAPWYVQDAQYIVQGRQLPYQDGTLKLLWTGWFIPVFYLLGPGVWQGNTGAALLGVACVWLIYALVKSAAGRKAALVALLLAGTNFILVMYSRTPLPYIGVCAASMLCLYLWHRLHSRPWLLFVPYTLAVVLAFHLKSVTGLVLPVMVLADALVLLHPGHGRKKLLPRALPYLCSGAIAAAALLVEYCLFRGAAESYVEYRTTMYVGEVTLVETLRGVLSMGFETSYFTQMPVCAFLAFLYPVLLARRWRERSHDELRVGIACIILMAGALAAFGFLKYRSLHYFIIMSPAMLIIAALCLREIAATRHFGAPGRNILATVLGFLLVSYLTYQVICAVMVEIARSGEVGDFVATSVGVSIYTKVMTLTNYGASWAMLLSMAVAVSLIAAWRLVIKKFPAGGIRISVKLAGRTAAVILAAGVLINLAFFIRFITEPNYSAQHLPREIPALVGENAKVIEHGCSLAGYGNSLRTEREGFDFVSGKTVAENPTHLFLNFFRARVVRPAPPMGEGPYDKPVAVITIKKVPAILYLLKNRPAGYRMSHYEKGIVLLRQGKYEEALAELRNGIRRHPESGVLRRTAGIALFRKGRIEEAETAFRKALQLLPEDFAANSYLGACLTSSGRFHEALEHLDRMERYYVLHKILRRITFDYREMLETAGTVDARNLLGLLEPILEN